MTRLVEHPLDEGWLDWLVGQLLAERRHEELVAIMVARGFPPGDADVHVREVAGSPILRAARRSQRQSLKAADLFAAFATLYGRSGFSLQRRRLTPEQFYREHFFANRPVVLTGLAEGWPALERWTPDQLGSRFGDVVVEVTHGRESDPRYEANFRDHVTKVRFGDYVSRVEQGGASNDLYLVARNHVLDVPGLRALKEDFACPDGFLDPATRQQPYVRLWFGPPGTLTPLHCDDRNILFAQVRGRKQVKLVAPYYYARLYNEESCYSRVDLEDVDLERFPAMADVTVLNVVLEPGECLFIPLGWWHWVKALELSISLTFTNFYSDDPPVLWRQLMA